MKKGLLLYLCMGAVAFTPLYAKSPNVPGPGFKKHPRKIEVAFKAERKQQPPQPSSVKVVKAPVRYASVSVEPNAKSFKLVKYNNELFDGQTLKWRDAYEYTYNEYGFLAACKNLNASFVPTYTYQWYEPGKWSRREFLYDDDSKEIDTRTFYPNGSVESWTNSINGMTGFTRHYDENGYLVRDINGGVEYIYTYFPLTHEWLQGETNPMSKIVYTVGDDNYIREEYHASSSDNETEPIYELVGKEQRWFSKDGEPIGSLNQYYHDGVVTEGNGYRSEITVEGNYIHDRDYSYSVEKGWIVKTEIVKSLNYDLPWTYDKDAVYTSVGYEFDYETEKLEKVSERIYSWVKPGIMKSVYKDYGDEPYEGYLMIDEDGDWDSIYYNPETGDYATFDEVEQDGEYIELYTYYDANGNETLKIKVKDNTWQQWNGSVWVDCKGKVAVYDGSERTEAEFNSAGQLVKLTEYETDGSIDVMTEYEYFANGFEETYYYYSHELDKLYKAGSYKYEVNGDMEIEIDFEYDHYGNISYAHKKDYDTKLKVHKRYFYNEGTQGWSLKYCEAESLKELLPNGMTQVIDRKIDENNGEVFNTKKMIYNNSEDMEYLESYNWDRVENKWIGEDKYERKIMLMPKFRYTTPADPTVIETDYFIPKEFDDEEYPDLQRESYESFRRWRWDDASDSWKELEGRDMNVSVDGNTMIIDSHDVTEYDGDCRETEKYEIDNAGRLLSHEKKQEINGTMGYSIKDEYSYDEGGRLVKHVCSEGSGTQIKTYEYAEISYIAGIENLLDQEAGYALDGNTLVVTGNSPIAIYNLQGMKVAQIEPGNTLELAPGAYIFNVKGKSAKILVK